MIAASSRTAERQLSSRLVSVGVKLAWTLCGVAWLAAISAGWAIATNYSQQPGEAGRALLQQPAGIPSFTSEYQLVMFVHPHCPCSAASVRELARLMSESGESLQACVVFSRPTSKDDAWAQTSLWVEANRIPRVTTKIDAGGMLTEVCGAATSGTVQLYDASGHLRFQGGLTAARGHEGDNTGKAAVLAMVRGQHIQTTVTPVFGCALADAENDDEK